MEYIDAHVGLVSCHGGDVVLPQVQEMMLPQLKYSLDR